MNDVNSAGLTAQEDVIMDHLTEAWNQFTDLTSRDVNKLNLIRDDIQDFRRAIHECQRILSMRVVARDREGWTNYE